MTQRDTSDIWAKELESNRKYTLAIQETFGQDMSSVLATDDMRGLLDNSKSAGGAFPWERPTVQLAAVASLTNSRPCHITEVGIRSEVWRQMRGAINYNSFPELKVREEYEEDQANISIGSVTAYMRRYSFFRIYARELGAETWINITENRAIAVLGASPQQKYNTIRIENPSFGSYEYRFVPVAGAEFYEGNRLGQPICLLDGRPLVDRDCHTYEKNGYHITITGELSSIEPDNDEWVFSTGEVGEDFGGGETGARGPIQALAKYETSDAIPTEVKFGESVTRYDGSNSVKLAGGFAYENRTWIWNGVAKTAKDGTKINENTIQIAEPRGKTFRYTEGAMKVQGNPEGDSWEYRPPFGAQYDIGDNIGSSSGYKYVVWHNAPTGQYGYIWNGTTVATVNTLTDDWVESSDGKMRFKRGTQKTSGDGDWVEVVGKRNLYATKGDGTLRDGCIEDFQRAENTPNICTFYHNGDVVARGAAEHPLIGYKDDDTRFVATRQIETDRELTPAEGWLVAKGGVRLIDGVTHGVCHIKDKNTYRFFYNGSEVGEIPVGSDANAYVTIPGGSKTFLLNGNQAKFVGVNNDVPCYAISIFQNGVWSITKKRSPTPQKHGRLMHNTRSLERPVTTRSSGPKY